mgnify:CR=1 FL=1|jgi:predicted transcriptional regulator
MKQSVQTAQQKIKPMVFRPTQFLAEKTAELAEREMVSQSAICRRALDYYVKTEMERTTYADITSF